MSKSIVIFGGGGFLGSRISQAALSKGWRVTSISRKGRPPPPPSTSEPGEDNDDWREAVEWVAADAFDPETYRSHLERADHVAHTIGVLDYRGVKTEASRYRAVDKVGLTLRDALAEMLPSSPGRESAELATYDRLNTEALVRTATEASRHASVQSFTYISTAGHFPGIPRRYVESKRRAEAFLATLQSNHFRTVALRPGFMYDDARPTRSIAGLLGLGYALDSSLGGRLSPLMGAAGVKPLHVARVGSAVVEAAADERVTGIVDTYRIEALADVRWRAEMIV